MRQNGSADAAYFDAMFAQSDDPWRFRTRWYELRKRAVTLACLPAPRYASAYEPGCANGELSAALAERCDHLLVSDGSAGAVTAARERLADLPHVEVIQAWLPEAWPSRRFDLVVVSEVAYYLSASDLAALADRLLGSLNAGGTVLACHWRHRIDTCEFDGDEVHARLDKALALPHATGLVERDFRLDVWCQDARSVAQREGLT